MSPLLPGIIGCRACLRRVWLRADSPRRRSMVQLYGRCDRAVECECQAVTRTEREAGAAAQARWNFVSYSRGNGTARATTRLQARARRGGGLSISESFSLDCFAQRSTVTNAKRSNRACRLPGRGRGVASLPTVVSRVCALQSSTNYYRAAPFSLTCSDARMIAARPVSKYRPKPVEYG